MILSKNITNTRSKLRSVTVLLSTALYFSLHSTPLFSEQVLALTEDKINEEFQELEQTNLEFLSRKNEDTGKTLIDRLIQNQLINKPFRSQNSDYALLTCFSPSFTHGKLDRKSEHTLRILSDIEIYKGMFSSLNIPSLIWHSELINLREVAYKAYSSASIEESHETLISQENNIINSLLEKLNKHSLLIGSSSEKFAMGGGCGAGEVEVILISKPAGASVRLIPAFNYLLCERQGFDPNNFQTCRGWKTVNVGEGFKNQLIGEYFYKAVWSKNKSVICNFVINSPGKQIIQENDCQ